MKKLLATICFLGLAGLVVGVGVFAGDTHEITATVIPYELILTFDIDRDFIDYGAMDLNTSKGSWKDGQWIAMTNWSNVNADLYIRGTGTENWTLSDVGPGIDTYHHQVGCNFGGWDDGGTIGTGDFPEYDKWAIGTVSKRFSAFGANGGESHCAFKMWTPTESSVTNISQNTTLTVTIAQQ